MENQIVLNSSFVDKYLMSANPSFVKAYLCAINLFVKGEQLSIKKISEILNITNDFTVIALEYWQREGAIKLAPIKGDKLNIEFLMLNEAVEVDIYEKPSYDVAQIFEEMDNSEELRELIALAEGALPRLMTSKDITTIFYLYDILKFPAGVILMLLEYCSSIEKTKIEYIEKVAIGWHQNGIITIGAVEGYIEGLEKREIYFEKIKEIFVITDRNLYKNEKQYVFLWFEEFHTSIALVEYAYNICLQTISSASFAYVNGILSKWHKENYSTVAEVEKAQESYKNSSNNNVNTYKPDYKKASISAKNRPSINNSDVYDYDQIEKLAAKKLEERFNANFEKK